MNGRERLVNAISLKKTDVLPATTHHVMPYYLEKYEDGISSFDFFKKYGLDAINWFVSQLPDEKNGEFLDESQGERSFLEEPRVMSDNWLIEHEEFVENGFPSVRFNIITPKKTLSMVLQSNDYTTWIIEHPIKEKDDIDIIAEFMPRPVCDIAGTLRAKEEIGDYGIVRSHIPTAIDMFGQPGCWQDACCMYGTEALIFETMDDSEWVHAFLRIIQEKKLSYIDSMNGAAYDILELGGGDGCTSVISPSIFEEFVAPYDKTLIDRAHKAGQKISYHLCGKKMAILDSIAEMGMDALETLTPAAMGGDAELSIIKKKLGDKMCLIGGFDQNTYLALGTDEDTRKAVRRCFAEAGEGGGYIISPSDHFFDAKEELLFAFADEAHKMKY